MKIIPFFVLFLFTACKPHPFEKKIPSNTETFSIIFSHNINGEPQPCGCQHFPQGGLAQVAGALEDKKKETFPFYVDTGDTLFSSPTIPAALEKSWKYTAQTIAQGLDLSGLNYFVPGDQDFAAGEDFLVQLSQKVNFTFLISNLSPQSKIKHQPWGLVKTAHKKFYFVGVVYPNLINDNYKNLFTDPKKAIEQALTEIKKNGFRADKDILVLLSHSGMSQDKVWAQNFPQFSWIVGAHSQDFLREPWVESKSQIVQVLSRNHYLGEVRFSPKEMNYSVIDVNQELDAKPSAKPISQMLLTYKEELRKIQEQEQKDMVLPTVQNATPNSVTQCLQCHETQSAHWQKTPHALAYGTLIQAKADKNPECIVCHTLNFGKPNGPANTDQLVTFEKKEENGSLYWKEYISLFNGLGSIRKLEEKKITALAKKLQQLDEKFKVTSNFTNVQCLHCHDKSTQHPFDNEKDKESDSPALKKEKMQEKCLQCHTIEQAPSWYDKNKKPNEKLQQALKKVSCPLKDV